MLYTAGTIGMHMVSATFVGAGMGWLIDNWLGTNPWGLLIGLLFGIVAGFRMVYQEAMRIIKLQEKKGQAPGSTEDVEKKDTAEKSE